MAMIYSMIARQRTSLVEYTPFQGNFPAVAQEILIKIDLNKPFAKYQVSEYHFYTLNKDGFIFLVMVDKSYVLRIAISFLKHIQTEFFNIYNSDMRNAADAKAFSGFIPSLQQSMKKYNQPQMIDKLSKLKQQLAQLQKVAQFKMSIARINKQGKEMTKKIKILQEELQQNTLQQENALLLQMRCYKTHRNHLGQYLRMNQIIMNSQKKLVYDQVIDCLKTIIAKAQTLLGDPKQISTQSLVDIWSLIYAYKPLQLDQYIKLTQFIPEHILNIKIEKIRPLIEKYIHKESIQNYERNRYILQLLQRTDISFDHINQAEIKFSKDLQFPAEISPTKHMFASKLEKSKEENNEKL